MKILPAFLPRLVSSPRGGCPDSRCSGKCVRKCGEELPRWACRRRLVSAARVITTPGVQKPHCNACSSSMGLLYRMQRAIRRGQSFRGHDLRAVGLHRQHQATAHRLAVDNHCAGATHAMFATHVHAGVARRRCAESPTARRAPRRRRRGGRPLMIMLDAVLAQAARRWSAPRAACAQR